MHFIDKFLQTKLFNLQISSSNSIAFISIVIF